MALGRGDEKTPMLYLSAFYRRHLTPVICRVIAMFYFFSPSDIANFFRPETLPNIYDTRECEAVAINTLKRIKNLSVVAIDFF